MALQLATCLLGFVATTSVTFRVVSSFFEQAAPKLQPIRTKIKTRLFNARLKRLRSLQPAPSTLASTAAESRGARLRLARYCNRTGKCLITKKIVPVGSLYEANLTLTTPTNISIARKSLGRSKSEAADNAALEILSSFPISRHRHSTYKDLEVTALVGDSALDLLIVTLGAQARLPADVIDRVRQTVVSNKALSHGAGRNLATRVEARVGKELLYVTDQFLPSLRECIGPELVASIEQGLRDAQA